MSRRTRPTADRRGRAPRLLALLVATAALAGACSSSSATGAASTDPQSVSLSVDGRERSYLLQPATGLGSGERAALVVVLHQEGGTPEGVATETALQDLRARGATLAYPAGVLQSWDAGRCCGPSKLAGVDDIAFLDALLADVGRRTPVDPARRALVGYSSGGMLTYRYVCGRPDAVAAAVVVSGSLETDCASGITNPDVLAVHGQNDGTIGLVQPRFIKALGLAPRPAQTSLELFTRSAGCAAPATSQATGAEVRRWAACRGGEVRAELVAGKGHGWGPLDATRRTQDFLVAQLLQG